MKKEEVRAIATDIAELLEGMVLSVLWMPQARVVSFIGTLFLKVSPYLYDIFKVMIDTTPLNINDEPLPTAAEMKQFFTTDYPELAELLTPLEKLTPRKRHLKMIEMYQQLRYSTNAEVLRRQYPLSGKKAAAAYERLVQDNHKRQRELIMRFVTTKIANEGILGEETAVFAVQQLRKLTDRDLTSKAARSKIGEALRLKWKAFLDDMWVGE